MDGWCGYLTPDSYIELTGKAYWKESRLQLNSNPDF